MKAHENGETGPDGLMEAIKDHLQWAVGLYSDPPWTEEEENDEGYLVQLVLKGGPMHNSTPVTPEENGKVYFDDLQEAKGTAKQNSRREEVSFARLRYHQGDREIIFKGGKKVSDQTIGDDWTPPHRP